MTATYHLTLDELNPEFVDRLKQMFSAGQVTIMVENHDETDYLLSDPANKAQLMRSMQQAEEGKLINVDFDDIVSAGQINGPYQTDLKEETVLLELMEDSEKEGRLTEGEQADFKSWLINR